MFEKFGLQLLIVAPFDAKAKVTEPFVDYYIHVVKKNNRSRVLTMTAAEFQERFSESTKPPAPARTEQVAEEDVMLTAEDLDTGEEPVLSSGDEAPPGAMGEGAFGMG